MRPGSGHTAALGLLWRGGRPGFIYPELSDAAQHDEQDELSGRIFDGYYSLARTCEISLSERSGHEFESIVYLVEEAAPAALVAGSQRARSLRGLAQSGPGRPVSWRSPAELLPWRSQAPA